MLLEHTLIIYNRKYFIKNRKIFYKYLFIKKFLKQFTNILVKPFIYNDQEICSKRRVKIIKLIVLFFFFFEYFINRYSKYMFWMNLFSFVLFVQYAKVDDERRINELIIQIRGTIKLAKRITQLESNGIGQAKAPPMLKS